MISRLIEKIENYKQKKKLWFLFISLALLLRLIVSQMGYNFDVASWAIVGEIIKNGGVVYTETYRYTTGPVWCYILGVLFYFQELLGIGGIQFYHLLIALVISVFDILTAWLIWKNYKFSYAILFLFNPISILITGFHSQFDNIAVFVAFLSWIILKNNYRGKGFLYSSILIGVSMLVKHIFVFYPVWIFFLMNKVSYKKRIIYLSIPYLVFLLGFLPFLIDPYTRTGVINHVFKYKSFSGSGLLAIINNLLLPNLLNKILAWLPYFSDFKIFFLLGMLITGYFVAKYRPNELFLIYLISMIAFTTSIVDQYMIIPCIACSFYYYKFEIRAFMVICSLYLVFISLYNVSCWIYPIIFNIDHSTISLIKSDLSNGHILPLFTYFYDFVNVISFKYDTLIVYDSLHTNSGMINLFIDILVSLRSYTLPFCQLWLLIFIIRYVFLRKVLK